MTKMALMSIYGKNVLNSTSQEQNINQNAFEARYKGFETYVQRNSFE